MKRLLFLVIILMMTLSIADSFAQNIHYQLDKKGELYVVPTSAVKDLQITFKSNVPDSIKRQEEILSQLRRIGKYELSSEQIRGGKFESFLLWYVPRHHKKELTSSVTNSDHMLVSYDDYKEFGSKVFNWIPFLGLFSLLLIFLLYRKQQEKRTFVKSLASFLNYALAIGFGGLIGISLSNGWIGLISVILAVAANYIVWGIGREYKTMPLILHLVMPTLTQKIFLVIYITLVVTAVILAYYYGIGIDYVG